MIIMARKFQIWAILLMVCAMGFTVAAQSASLGVSSPKTITGVVVSAFDKEPLKGVYVRLKGTNIGVATDIDGHFNIEAQLGDTLSVKVLDCDEIEVAVDAQQLRISLYNFVSGYCCGENLPQGVFGTVCNEDEKALQGATVTALPSGNSVVTDSKGYFNITKIKESDKSLRVEHPSYKTIQGRISGNCFEIWLERNIVTGQVLSAEDGEPVIGAHICAKGTKNGTASDFDGKFSICVTDGTVLTVSCPGLKPQEIVADGRQPMTVVLETDENAPDYLTSSFNVIGIIRMDSLDYVLPESEFLIAQKYNKDLQGEFYQLKQTDIGRAKWLLDREITRRAYLPGTGPMPLENYAKQYFGVKRNGHRLIYINLVAKANLKDHNYINYIDKKLVVVFDGGDKYGRALIDLDTEGIVYIHINGPKNVVKN
jgi:hypothetical protein